jgi:spore protease
MWEETGDLLPNSYSTETEKKFFGKITLISGTNVKTGKNFYTVYSREDLFGNEEHKRRLTDEICAVLNKFFKKYSINPQSKILVAALGNEKITADSLGARVAEKLTVTSHLYDDFAIRTHYGNLCSVKCGVGGVTGIESFELLSSAVKAVKPDLIIAVDTLSCGKTERLGHTVQITDNGIEPGGGVDNPKKRLTEQSLGVPVIAVGVPFVIYVTTILSEYGVSKTQNDLNDLVVTAKEIDFLAADYAEVIAKSINTVVHGQRGFI